MRIGIAQRDITPPPGLDLTGFFNREQPSVGVRDPLFAKALFLEQEGRRLLWIHADLLGLSRSFVNGFRRWADCELGLAPGEVMLSATHTHAGPATVRLLGCGERDEAYLRALSTHFEEAAREACGSLRVCRLVTAAATLDLAVDRRRKPTALADPRMGLAGWRAPDGRFLAAVASYSMHPVVLGATRMVSADWPGRAAATLAARLPGAPVTLVCSGACGNLNPPRCGAPESDLHQWADAVAETAAGALLAAEPIPEPAAFSVASDVFDLPLEAWSAEEIEQHCALWRTGHAGDTPQDRRFLDVLDAWRRNRLEALQQPRRDCAEAEVMAVRLGSLVLAGVNAEVFCHFTARLREQTGADVFTLGCCNGVFGYLPHAAAYDEGGYEPGSAHLYYDTFRVRRGGLEFVVDHAADLFRPGMLAGR